MNMKLRQVLKLTLICLLSLSTFCCFSGGAFAANNSRAGDEGSRETKLLVPRTIVGELGKETALDVQLTNASGMPLKGEVIVLLANGTVETYARTDDKGVGQFHLPDFRSAEEYALWIAFPGNDKLNATSAITTLRFPHLSTSKNYALQQTDGFLVADRGYPNTSLVKEAQNALVANSPLRNLQGDQSFGLAGTFVGAVIPAGGQDSTHLIVADQITAQPGAQTPIAVRLTLDSGRPLPDQNIVLFADDKLDLHARTNREGIAVFFLPTSLSKGDHELSIVYPGSNQSGGAISDVVVHVNDAAPTTVLKQTKPEIAPTANVEKSSLFSVYATTLLAVVTNASDAVEHARSIAAEVAATFEQNALTWREAFRIRLQTMREAAQPALISAGETSVRLASQPGVWLVAILVLAALAIAPLLRRQRTTLPVSLAQTPLTPLTRGLRFALPLPVWYAIRILGVGVALGVTMILFLRPAMGLFIFWKVFIPVVPLVFFLAPGLWRNVCPMATLNQMPRLLTFSKAWTTPKWMQKYGYLIAISLFLILVSSRKTIFNQNGVALGSLLLVTLGAALTMGTLFKGKSGWCSSICPLLPVQRIYGQTPFVTVTHAHCQPCVGCTKNCYDLSPANAYLADLYDEDRQFAGFRKAFVGLFPGFILAFYLLPNPPLIPNWEVYALLGCAGVLSMGTFFLVEAATKATSNKITVLYGAAALNLYYWFNSMTLGSLLATTPPQWFVWTLRATVFGLTLLWIQRTYQKEREYIELTFSPRLEPIDQAIPLASPTATPPRTVTETPEVIIEPSGQRIPVENNRTLLEIIEQNNLPIESGCRMGLCGADPICVHAGMDNLSKMGSDERTTLERLALAPNTRLACMARVRGPVKVSLAPEKPDIYRSSIIAGFRYDASIKKVVIVGNGIAGVTAADHIRRRHPKCEIHLIGREPHLLYNRMGITRLIYGRSAMQGLYLLPEQWYEDFGITCWLNTHVDRIDTASRQVHLATGESLAYDRLIMTTGSRSFVPPIAGFGIAGTYVLRSAEDAISIRAFVQEHKCKEAVIAGGGLLGLEAAYGLHKLGLTVTVLERSNSLLTRQLDARGGEYLKAYLERLGMNVMMESEVKAVRNERDGAAIPLQVTLKSGQELSCDLLLVAAGIQADVELGRAAGLEINRGVIVDSTMQTSDSAIFAAGDVAEFDGKVLGLWPVAVSQAEVAAANAVSEPSAASASYSESPPVTMLKVAGIDLMSIGRIQAENDGDLVIALEEREKQRYRKLILADGKIVGAILLGYPQEAAGVTEAAKQQIDVTPQLDALRAGDWSSLQSLA